MRKSLLLSATLLVACIGCVRQPAVTPEEKLLKDRATQLRTERLVQVRRKAAALHARFASAALSQKGPFADAAYFVPPLTEMLRDNDPVVRRTAVRALGNIGPKAKPAIPVLTKLLQDQSVQEAAAEALGKIQRSPH